MNKSILGILNWLINSCLISVHINVELLSQKGCGVFYSSFWGHMCSTIFMMNRLINSLVTHSFPTSVPEHKIMFMIINLMRIELRELLSELSLWVSAHYY